MSALFYCLLLLAISSVTAVPLDGSCTQPSQCEGTGVTCTRERCQCDAPWYTPCRTSCEVQRRFVYEGEECKVTDNCVDNMRCTDTRCVCVEGFVGRNGLCFKRLNEACTNSSECWSNYCISSQCTCPSGYEAREDNIGCRRRLVKIYSSWAEANQAGAFCSDSTSCINIIAQCFNDTANPSSKYCRCPTGYRVTADNERCESIESPHFSPLETQPTQYEECGTCKDDNAVCINAAGQTTCWCRAPYIKSGDRCERRPSSGGAVIFPTPADRSIHDFTGNCLAASNATQQVQSGLCTCARGYRFVAANQACERIPSEWISEALEYGLCTRITSKDDAVRENDLCPAPLQCRERKDKYVCSCGEDQFRDITDPTVCAYFIGKTTRTATDKCPTLNAERNATSGVCQCMRGFRATNLSRQCEVTLAAEPFQPTCSVDRSNDGRCNPQFGKQVFLCSAGECRCSGNQSFSNTDRTHCYAPVGVQLTAPIEDCPPNSVASNNRCNCQAGYRASADARSCVRQTAQLIAFAGPAPSTIPDGFTSADCRVLFTGPVEAIANLRCQCQTGTQLNADSNGCWYRLETNEPNFNAAFCPPNSTALTPPRCVCDTGYTGSNDRCVRIATQLYVDGDAAAPNITGLTDPACNKWFGTGSAVSSRGLYCTCKSAAYLVTSTTNCRFFINAETADIKGPCTCPENSNATQSGSVSRCVCNPGYHVTANNRTCVTSDITLVGSEVRPPAPSNCVNFTNDDCTAKFGGNAFCRNQRCYCDRRASYINSDGRCEPFANYKFPAVYELQSYTCAQTSDCGGKENVECALLDSSNQRVCKCTEGSFLDVQSRTCVRQRCRPGCDASRNFECRGYDCVCATGFYLSGSTCVAITNKLELNQPCNNSAEWALAAVNNSNNLVCDFNCNRARCAAAYEPDDDTCVPLELENDRCVYRDSICSSIDANSICDRDENQCACAPSYYSAEGQCAQAVGSVCTADEDCRGNMRCEGKRCQCSSGQQDEEAEDIYGRPITRCRNDVGQLRFSAMLVVLLACFRLFLL